MDFEEAEWTTEEDDDDYVEEEIIMVEGEADDELFFEEENVDSGIEVSAETVAAIENVLENRKNPNKFVILQGPTKEEKKKVVERLLANRKRQSIETSSPQKLSKEEKKAAIEKWIAKRRHEANKEALAKAYARRRHLARTVSPKEPSKEAKKAALEKLYRKRGSRTKKSVPHDASTDAKRALLESLYASRRRRRPKKGAIDGSHTSAKKEELERFYARWKTSSKQRVPHDASLAAKMAVLESFYAEQLSKPTLNVPNDPTIEKRSSVIEKVPVKRKSETRKDKYLRGESFSASTDELNEAGVKKAELGTRKISSSSVEEILKRMASSSDDTIDVEGELLRKIKEAEDVQQKLERQLAASGVVVAEDIDYGVCMRKVAVIGSRMTEIGSAYAVHSDKKKQDALRLEYFKLEQDMAKYSNAMFYCDEYQAEQAQRNREWEAENHKANVEALRRV
ncbi:unnamed protein product [Cylindrotheca closterium]|uniref:Uncharacterized protein n=1 Tax=Cylindrotheca closterium TaxID=2856 RepID=A0AAD2JKY6_9STRA|nr:unnamed protein product [Cylindrotheca closterium]